MMVEMSLDEGLLALAVFLFVAVVVRVAVCRAGLLGMLLLGL